MARRDILSSILYVCLPLAYSITIYKQFSSLMTLEDGGGEYSFIILTYVSFSFPNFSLDFYYEKVRNLECIQSCLMMSITFGYPFIDKHSSNETALVKMYFKSSIHVRKSSISYRQVGPLVWRPCCFIIQRLWVRFQLFQLSQVWLVFLIPSSLYSFPNRGGA